MEPLPDTAPDDTSLTKTLGFIVTYGVAILFLAIAIVLILRWFL